MPRGKPKGLPKSGGRKAGTPNKIKASADELMNDFGFDPLKGMMSIAADLDVDIAIRARMFSELSQYVYAKRRAIEHSGPGGGPIHHAVDPLEAITSELSRLAERNRQAEGSPKT